MKEFQVRNASKRSVT